MNQMNQMNYTNQMNAQSKIEETKPFVSIELSTGIVEKKTRCNCKAYIIGAGVILISIILSTLLYIYISHTNSNNNKDNSRNIINLKLDTNDLITNWEKSKQWNITKYIYGKDFIFRDNNTLKAIYPQGSWAPSAGSMNSYGGFNFYAQPSIFPSSEICFKYDIKFANNFQWVKGGKLPGLWIGNIGASGGKHNLDGYSYRFSWKQMGEAQAYLYIPNNQTPIFTNQSGYVPNDIFGTSLWRGMERFETDSWYTIKLYVKLNTFNKGNPNTNGVISLSVNNKTSTFNQLVWIPNDNLKINGIMMDSFFGGSDSSWATPITTYINFRNFSISNSEC